MCGVYRASAYCSAPNRGLAISIETGRAANLIHLVCSRHCARLSLRRTTASSLAKNNLAWLFSGTCCLLAEGMRHLHPAILAPEAYRLAVSFDDLHFIVHFHRGFRHRIWPTSFLQSWKTVLRSIVHTPPGTFPRNCF